MSLSSANNINFSPSITSYSIPLATQAVIDPTQPMAYADYVNAREDRYLENLGIKHGLYTSEQIKLADKFNREKQRASEELEKQSAEDGSSAE